MAADAELIRFPKTASPEFASLYTGRMRECVCCLVLKEHKPENFRGCDQIRNGKRRLFIRRMCRACEHLKRTAYEQKRRKSSHIQFKPKRFENYRENNLRSKYGISVAQFEILLESQGNRCAICRTDSNGTHQSGRKKAFAVDHCHSTGKVRGLLCSNCNHGLGELRDDPDLLRVAIAYLERHK